VAVLVTGTELTTANPPDPGPTGRRSGVAGKITKARGSMWASVGTTAVAKVFVMGVSGILGLFTTRLIIEHFGTDAYAQYGLLTSFPSLLPFADLGMAAVVINAVAGADDVRTDRYLRNAITTAFRILIGAGVVIGLAGLLISVLDLWPTLLGEGLTAGGANAAFLCLLVFGLVLPMTVGQRVMVGLRRTTAQVASQSVVSPFMLLCVGTVILAGVPFGDYVSIFSYLANSLVSIICLVLAARILKPQLGQAIRDIPKIRSVRGVKALNLAWPMLIQMIALPIAMQTDRLLLSHLTSGDELAQYNLSSQLFGMVLQAIAAGGVALWPIYARARARKDVQSPFKPMLVFTVGGLALAGLLALLSPWIARFVSDGKIVLDIWLVIGFVAFVGVQAAKYPLGMYMTDKRGLRFQVWPILAMVPANLGISWWLIGVIGPGGPIIGSMITVLFCQVLPNYLYVRRDLKKRRTEARSDQAATGSAPEAESDINV
jgi:O-antigen/teichoic acid export membrane protein